MYCRLVEMGFNKSLSMSICRYYETLVYGWLTWLTALAVKTCRFCRLHELTGLKEIAALVTVSFVLSFTVAGATYMLLHWML